jgi:hypothetical protein
VLVTLVTPSGDLVTPGNDVVTPSGDLVTPGNDVVTPSNDVVTQVARVRTQHKRIINFAIMLLCMIGTNESTHLLVLTLHGTHEDKSYVVVLADY